MNEKFELALTELPLTEATTAPTGVTAPNTPKPPTPTKTPNNSPASTLIDTPTSAQVGMGFFSSMVTFDTNGVPSVVSRPRVNSNTVNSSNKNDADDLMDDADLNDMLSAESSKLLAPPNNQLHNNQDGLTEDEVIDWGDSDNESCTLKRGSSY
ncbi:MAG: hypothetical protein ACRC0M_07200 [Legionella sp.]